MLAVLISTYELGHQPFGLSSPAAWLSAAGAEVECIDLAVDKLNEATVSAADVIAFYLPMHTATRLATRVIERVRSLNPRARIAAYGLYAPMNADLLRSLGVRDIIGGEFEDKLVELLEPSGTGANGCQQRISLSKLRFRVPDRRTLPPLDRYAFLTMPEGDRKVVGYTEASRGCKHRCRHCPVVPIYRGQFRIVQRDIVLEDIRQQVRAGARHITFGDPDFFNGSRHAIDIVEALHAEFSDVTYDATIKIEHLLNSWIACTCCEIPGVLSSRLQLSRWTIACLRSSTKGTHGLISSRSCTRAARSAFPSCRHLSHLRPG